MAQRGMSSLRETKIAMNIVSDCGFDVEGTGYFKGVYLMSCSIKEPGFGREEPCAGVLSAAGLDVAVVLGGVVLGVGFGAFF